MARQWQLQAMADPDVTAATGLFIGNVPWDRPDVDIGFTTFGIDPAAPDFTAATASSQSFSIAAGRPMPGS